MKRRRLSLVLCFVLVLGLMPSVGLVLPTQAATASQSNIVARADYLYNITWLCQKTVYGWCGNYTYATSVSAAQTDASNMLDWIKGKTFEYPATISLRSCP